MSFYLPGKQIDSTIVFKAMKTTFGNNVVKLNCFKSVLVYKIFTCSGRSQVFKKTDFAIKLLTV